MESYSRVGIAITHRNREEAFNKTYSNIVKHIPKEAVLVVVDDASDVPCELADHRFEDRAGISVAKNKCISLLYDKGCEYFFLFDSDVYPIVDDWHLPYINSPHPHLCYTFLPHTRIVDGHKYHALGNGCMMYIHRSVVEKIGGFDTDLFCKFEHVQFSHRAHAAGLIPHPFIDVVGSDKLFHAMDERNEVIRTFTDEERDKLMAENRAHYYKTRNLTDFIPYK